MLTDRDKAGLHSRTIRAIDELEYNLLVLLARKIGKLESFASYEYAPLVGEVSIEANVMTNNAKQRVLNAAQRDFADEFMLNGQMEARLSNKAAGSVSAALVRNSAKRFSASAFTNARLMLESETAGCAQGAVRGYIMACETAAVQVSRIGTKEAMRNAIAWLGQQGITSRTYTRSNGTVVSVPVDVGIRRAMVNAGQRGRMEQTLFIARETGHDLVEVNTTANARESHAEWQGQVYSLSGTDPNHEQFQSACNVGDPVDGIGGYNCGHEVAMFYPEYGKTFSDPLKGTGYTTDQVRELTNQQRALERGIRRDKRTVSLLESQGMSGGEYNAAIRDKQAQLRALVSENSAVLYRQPEREKTYGI